MSKLKNLVMNIYKDNKMSSEEELEMLSDYMEECSCGVCEGAYQCLYEKVYGKTISKELAIEWVDCMEVTDGSDRENGTKWTFEQCYDVGNKHSIDWNKISKIDWFVVLNMMYSDNYRSAKKHNLHNDTDYFADLAYDWLCDHDVAKDKLYNYYFNVVM